MSPRMILAAGLAVAFALYSWWLYDTGVDTGEARVTAQWHEATVKARAEASQQREEANAIAADLEAKLQNAEARYARTNKRLSDALNTPFTCPASGRVGDVLLPAALVDSMFNREPPGAAAPGPSASQPDGALR